MLRTSKWIGALLLLTQGGQIIYDLAFWVPRMAMILDTMVEGGKGKLPGAFWLVDTCLTPLIALAGLLTLGGLLLVVTRSRLSSVVTISGGLTLMFLAFGSMLNKILITPLIAIVSNLGG